jgi:hypothetical protein
MNEPKQVNIVISADGIERATFRQHADERRCNE